MRLLRRIGLSLILLLIFGQQVLARADVLCHLSIDEGLSGDCVYRIVKDSRGYVWIGTNNGLLLYDGQQLIPIQSDARKGENLVHDIVELKDGRMAVAMRGGLYKVDFPQLRAERLCQLAGPVHALLVKGDTLLVGGNKGLAQVHLPSAAVSWLTLGSSVISRDNHILDLVQGERGSIWVIGQYAVYQLNASMQAKRVPLTAEVTESGIRCGAWVGGKLYIGTSVSGLFCLDTATGDCKQVRENVGNVIFDLCGSGSRLYIASDGSGAYVYDTKKGKVTESFHHHPLPTNSVYTFWRDEKLNVNWFGFFREGMAHTFHQQKIVVPYSMGTFDSRCYSVRSFCRQGDYMAIGTREGLYVVNERTENVRHYDPSKMGGSNVLGIVWFGGRFVVATYDGGLCTVDPVTGDCVRPASPLLRKGTFMRVAVVDSNRLMALSNQILLLNEKLDVVNVLTDRNSELKGDVLTDVLIDRKGKAWLSAESGLALFDIADGIVKKSGFPQGFFNREPVLVFGEWKGNGVLAASEHMVYRCSENLSTWDSIDIASRIDIHTISFMVPQNGHYWVGTDRGVFYMDSLLTRFRHFGKAEGLMSLFCNPQSWQIAEDGTFWFSTREGIYKIVTNKLKERELVGKRIALTATSVGDRTLTAAQCVECSEKKELSIWWNFGTEELRLNPIVLDFAQPAGRYVEWQIDDSEMHAASERQPIMIDGLSLGSHVLRLYLPGSKEPVEYRISVKPAPLFWFEVLFVVALVIIVVLLWSYKKRLAKYRAARRRKHQLDMKLAAERSVADYQKSEERKRQEEEERKRNAMYQRSRSTEDENRQLLGQVRQLMEQQKLYRQLDLRVADVAAAVGCSPNKLSQMLSMYADVSFYDFVNDYRIEEFKRKALDKEFAHLTTLAIAESCGLKKTTFYAAFSKKEGCTPAEWKQLTESSSKQSELSSEKM